MSPLRAHLLRLVGLALAASATGCLDAQTTTCGGLVCPVGRTCDEHRVTCVLPAQESECVAAADGDVCEFFGSVGACDHGVCHVVVCGNGRLERDEECDDGNIKDRDGCSADCRSNETCGNGVVDVELREDCDDRNFASHDGCSSRCTLELPTWTDVSISGGAGTIGATLVFDATRGQVVRFGGQTPTLQVVTEGESWNGRQWVRLPAVHEPPPRSAHVLVADAGARRLVLFGGKISSGTRLGDTWIHDGHDWTALAAGATAPSARHGAAAAYDVARDEIVLFGGDTMSGPSAETWVLTGEIWALRAVPGPPARRGAVMAYDAKRARVVLFGGRNAAGVALDDTWEWNGTAWALASPATVPTARGALVYDATRGAVVAFGGDEQSVGEVWSYDGVDWTLVVTTGPAPVARTMPGLAYDAARRRLVLYGGGHNLQMGIAFDDSFELVGDAWSAPTLVTAPPQRVAGRMAWDGPRQRMLVFGGFQPPAVARTDTWAYDGRRWDELAPTAKPPPGTGGQPPRGFWVNSLIVDEPSGAAIMLRDAVSGPDLETWRFDGGAWVRVALTGAPPTRQFAAVAHDTTRRVLVCFGGSRGMTQLADVWELDLATLVWTARTPALPGPSARSDAGAAYDPIAGRVVVFGGRAGMMPFDDTWAWDGAAWSEISTASRPPRRGEAVLVFHAARGRLLLYGGVDGPMPMTDLWEQTEDGGWIPVDVATGPGPRKTPTLAYDPVRRVVILHGGDPQQDTWELSWRSTISDETCSAPDMPGAPAPDRDADGLAGCADPDCDGVACAAGAVCQGGACGCQGGAAELACGDGVDDDCDGAYDCADSDCAAATPCAAEPSCSSAGDDDTDGRADCADPGCAGAGSCEAFELSCGDLVDNDGDGRVDCADTDCWLVACPEVTP